MAEPVYHQDQAHRFLYPQDTGCSPGFVRERLMRYVDIGEPDLAVRYARGVSSGIAAGYGMVVPDQPLPEVTYSPAYTRGFRAGYTAVWNARYGTAERNSVRRWIRQEEVLRKVRVWSAVREPPRLREEFVAQWLGPKWTPGNPLPR